jgi:hypothetical protein
VGAFGRNHARVYHQLAQQGDPVTLVAVVDPDVPRADDIAREYGARAFGSVEQLVATRGEVQAASVAVPTAQHVEVASALMAAGIDVLIEKPLAALLAQADDLMRLHGALTNLWSATETFHPAECYAALVTHPMFFRVHRPASTPRSLTWMWFSIYDSRFDIALLRQLPVKEICASVSDPVRKSGYRERRWNLTRLWPISPPAGFHRAHRSCVSSSPQYISVDCERQTCCFEVMGDEREPSVNLKSMSLRQSPPKSLMPN